MPDIASALHDCLLDVRCHGDFYTRGVMEIAAPNVRVEDLGLLSLPFQHEQLEQLLAGASRAPFGRGTQTLVDTAVRKTWQIDASRLTFEGRHWQRSLDAIVAAASAGLGVSEPVTAQLYKLLVYDTGSFFVGHRDTEKAPGMFATLVIVLPSVYTGGELLIRHQGREVCLELAATDLSEAAFAAFYADCVHEVRPVTGGTRLTLVYNLLRQGRPAHAPPQYPAEQAALAAMLGRWAGKRDAQCLASPQKLVFPLAHAYSPAELAFTTLKNADAARAQVLAAAARQAGCEIHVAHLAVEERGSAESAGYGHAAADEYEIIDIIDRAAELSGWRAPDGEAAPFGNLPLFDDELSPPGALRDAVPDEQHFHEATGNEGASFERRYLRTALVLWPLASRLAVITEGGPATALPLLQQYVLHCDSACAEAAQLASLMLDSWPEGAGHCGAEAARLLDCLERMGDQDLIARFLVSIAAGRYYRGVENDSLARAAHCLPLRQAAGLIAQIVAANARLVPGACADLLARCGAWDAEAPALLAPAAQLLVDAATGTDADAPLPACWRSAAEPDSALVLALLEALRSLGMAALGQRAVTGMLARYAPDAVLVAAAVRLEAPLRQFGPAARLGAWALAYVRGRMAQPLAAPVDFRRACTLDCGCVHCLRLVQFLDDPDTCTWSFKAAETHRRHVQETIRRNGCDIDCLTVRTGSPHRLECTKNQASHERRLAQRDQDRRHARQLAWAGGA